MKINKLLVLALICCFAISCTKDTFEEQTTASSNERLAYGEYDNSQYGLYKGLFSTEDGLTRGSLVVTLLPEVDGTAQLTLSTGQVIELKSRAPKVTVDGLISDLRFTSEGPLNVSLDFSVGNEGLNPSISNVVFNELESNILVAKNQSRAPLTAITGTYVRTSGTGGFPTNNRTWNIMTIGSGEQTYAVQIWYGGRLYNTPPSGSQGNCVDNGDDTETCDISGSASILGHAVTWSGTHTYDTFDDNSGCSGVSGTWAAPTYGNSAGTFVSDSSCDDGVTVINDYCADALPIGLGETLVGYTYLAGLLTATNGDTPDFCDDNLFGTADGIGVWYTFTPNADVDVTVDTVGSSFDTQLRVFSGSCGSLVCVGNDDDSAGNYRSLLAFSATAGETYYFFIGGYNTASGEYYLTLTEILPPAPVPDFCVDAYEISCGGSVSGDTNNATNTDSPDFCDENLFLPTQGAGVWYTFTASEDDRVTVDTEGSSFDTQMRVFSGSCGALDCVGNDDDGGTGLLSSLSFDVSNGETYYIFVSGYNNAVGAYQINLTCGVEPPVELNYDLTCGDVMIDNGLDGNYLNNTYDVYHIDAGAGNTIELNFTLFDIEDYYDDLAIYDGPDTSSPIITTSVGGASNEWGQNGGFTWMDLQDDTIVSSGQYLTLVFSSDSSQTYAGFVAEVVCISGGRTSGIGLQTTSLNFRSNATPRHPKVSNQQILEARKKAKIDEIIARKNALLNN